MSALKLNPEQASQLLDQWIQEVEPAARLVPGRLIRRLVVRLRDLETFILMVPHGWGLAVRAKDALQHASAQELGLASNGKIPEWLYLITRPSARFLSGLDERGLKSWLKARLVHLVADKALMVVNEVQVNPIHFVRDSLDEREWEQVIEVLTEERRLLPGANPDEEEAEFLATVQELALVDPGALPIWFPSVRQSWILEIINQAEILEPARLIARKLDELVPGKESGPGQGEPCGECLELARNLVLKCSGGEHSGQGVVEGLAQALSPVYGQDIGEKPALRSFLKDLHQVVSLAGMPLEKVDAFRWAFSLGRESLRRELPFSGWLMALRSLRSAIGQVSKLGLSGQETAKLLEYLGICRHWAEEKLRTLVRPKIEAVFREVGLVPEKVLERLAWRQVVDELLERLADRGEIALGDLRDALASHRIKMADLSGVGEWLGGDLLLRADRKLAVALPGAYRPGEFYMRSLQRLSSAFYGNPPGRALFLYVMFPLAIVYVVFKGLQEIANLLLAVTGRKREILEAIRPVFHETPWLPFEVELTDQKKELIMGNTPTYVLLAAFVSLLIFSPVLRKRVGRFVWKVGVFLHRVLIDFPTLFLKGLWWIIRLPYIRQIYQHGIRPAIEAAIAMLLLRIPGWLPEAGDGRLIAVFAAFVALFLSPPWRILEEAAMDVAGWAWNHLGLALLLAILDWIVAFFRWLVDVISLWLRGLERLLLQPPAGKGGGLLLRGTASLLISPFVYLIRALLLIFVEPQVNPVKHFPVVTVGHKLMLTLAPGIASSIAANTGKNYLEVLATVTFVLTLIPGFMGFLVWEFKENWRLYKANESRFIRPQPVGSHGETMVGMLAPGFHSGTLPKLYRRLRRADPVSRATLAIPLEHAFSSVRDYFEDECAEVWRLASTGPEMILQRLEMGPNLARASFSVPGHGELKILLAWRGWWLEGAVEQRPTLDPCRRQVLEFLIEGFWHKSGVVVARGDWDRGIPDLKRLSAENGMVRAFNREGHHADYPTEGTGSLRPSKAGWPTLRVREALVQNRPLSWKDWDAQWEKTCLEGPEPVAGA